MKPGAIIPAILGAGILAGVIVGLMVGGLPTWLQSGPSEREERQHCEASMDVRGIDHSVLSASPDIDRREWPHTVIFILSGGTATCRFERDGTLAFTFR